ncbi:MAG: PilZ domain-containing protein [Pseudomonadota bacterium]
MLQQTNLSSAVSKILANKRDSERVKSTFSASIYAQNAFQCHCIIRDVSNSGMKLEVQRDIQLEEEFEIKTPAMPEVVTVRMAWRRYNEVGVEFLAVHQPQAEQDLAS